MFHEEGVRILIDTRYELATERIGEIPAEEAVQENCRPFFAAAAEWLLRMDAESRFLMENRGRESRIPEEVWKAHNNALYEEILPEAYAGSYANPAYAVQTMGRALGPLLSALYYELRSCIPFVYRGMKERVLIRMELFLEIYTAFVTAFREEGGTPRPKDIREILWLYLTDYAQDEEAFRIRYRAAEDGFAVPILEGSDLKDPSFLYRFGEYVTDKERETAERLADFSEEELCEMAGLPDELKDRPEGESCGIVQVSFPIGCARAAMAAIALLKEKGYDAAVPSRVQTLFYPLCEEAEGACGACANPQYAADHREDTALFADALFWNRRLEGIREALADCRGDMLPAAGPPVRIGFLEKEGKKQGRMEVSASPQAPRFTAAQRKARASFSEKAAALTEETGLQIPV